jgi:rod shape-determining protein MreD
MARSALFSSLILAACVLLQTTLLEHVAIRGAVPDLSLVALLFIATRKGSFVGEVGGFVSGLLEDFLSLSPLGLHALLKTVLGYLCGLTRGKVFVDPILMPLLLAVSATIIKRGLASLVMLMFQEGAEPIVWGVTGWVELGYNAILAPFVFALMGLVPLYQKRRGDQYT